MKKVRGFLLGLIIGVAAHCSAADALTEALQKGLFEEEANQNLEAAIKAYQDVLTRADDQRRVAATALFRLAECYRKQGKTNEATAEYRRLVRDYTDQSTLVNLSRQNLIGLGGTPAVASSTPPKNGDPLTTDEEQQEIQGIRALIQNSPDLINAQSRGLAPPGPSYAVGTVLHQAAFKGHLLVAEYLLSNGAQVNALDSRNQTALYHAAHNGHKRMVELLVSKGAQPSLGDSLPLHAVAERGFIGVAEVLLANKTEVNALRNGKTALHIAIEERNLQIAELLLKNGADVNIGYDREWKGNSTFGGSPLYHLGNLDGTPLHFAVQGQNVEAARMLLAKNADANARSGAGLTPLHYVVNASSPENIVRLAQMLLDAGAKIDTTGSEDGNLTGWTPLHVAVFHKQPKFVALLLEKGANPNLPLPPRSGNEATALNMAISGGASEIIDMLLQHKADTTARDHNGDTPLVRAIRERNHRTIELLLSKGADPNALDAYGFPPLHVALGAQPPASTNQAFVPGPPILRTARLQNQPGLQGYGGVTQPSTGPGVPPGEPLQEQSIVEVLLTHKADPNLRDKQSETALHVAAERRNQTAVELLLKYKADPNARTGFGMTSLHKAVSVRQDALVDLLLANNADVTAAMNNGDTALHWAAGFGLTNITAKLVQRGADVNACGRDGDTPLRRAIHTLNNKPTIELLLKLGADIIKSCEGHATPLELAMIRQARDLADLLRKHHPKKLAVATFDGAVVKPSWFWEADKPATLSEAIDAVGLNDTADLTQVSIGRGSSGYRHNLVAIREKRTEDVPLKHGDRIHVPARVD